MKRITGLNAHLQKIFLVLLIVFIAFSSCKEKNSSERNYAILFYDLDTYETIGNVSVMGIYDKSNYISNQTGFVTIPSKVSKDNSLHVSLSFRKEGYVNAERRFEHNFEKGKGSSVVELIGLRKGKADSRCNNCFLATMVSPSESKNSYQAAKNFLPIHTKQLSSMK